MHQTERKKGGSEFSLEALHDFPFVEASNFAFWVNPLQAAGACSSEGTRELRIKDHSCPVLRLSHKTVW